MKDAKSTAPEFTLGEIFGGSFWFVATEFVTLAILIAFPQIILILPKLMFT